MRIDRVDRAVFARSGRAEPARQGDQQPLEVVACGRPLPGYQVRILDDDGRELPDREAGRLQFDGPSATRAICTRLEGRRGPNIPFCPKFPG